MKYDVIISLGEFCATASALKESGITPETYPLDWSGGVQWEKCGECGFMGKIDLICNDFKHAFELKDLTEFYGDEKRTRSILNQRTGLQYTHDFPWDKTVAETYSDFDKKYKRRVKRLNEKMNTSQNVLFVFVTRFNHLFPLAEFDEAYQKLSKKYPKTNIDFLILQDSYDMKADETCTLYEKEHIKLVLFKDALYNNNYGIGNRPIIVKEIAKHAGMNYFLFGYDDIPSYGLSFKEHWGRWTCASKVILKIDTQLPNQDLELIFKINPYLNKTRTYQKADIYVNNQKMDSWKWQEGNNPRTTLQIPKNINTNGMLEIIFEIDNPVSPKTLGLSEDTRSVALGFIDLLVKAL